MHSFNDLKSLCARLPEGWDAGDLCDNCGTMAVRHRLEDLACPVHNCTDQPRDHVHLVTCWAIGYQFHLDPQMLARRRLEATMAPGPWQVMPTPSMKIEEPPLAKVSFCARCGGTLPGHSTPCTD